MTTATPKKGQKPPKPSTAEELAKQALAKFSADYKPDPVDQAILMMMQVNPGMSHREIAERLGYKDRKSIGERINRPAFQEAQRKMMRDVGQLAIDTFSEMFRECSKILRGTDMDAKLTVIRALAAAWGKMEQAPTSQNIVFATMIGDGGALIPSQRQMTKEEIDRMTMRNVIEGKAVN